MKNLFTLISLSCSLYACSKADSPTELAQPAQFIQYNIARGNHSCDLSAIQPVNISRLLFDVKFDSTAVYTTADPGNQADINKLYGFSEGPDPHQNSARIGWAYFDGSLRLYAYAYNNGQRLSREIGPVRIGEVINCSISLVGQTYLFSINGVNINLGRGPGTNTANGYQLFPYFGGDETAPHLIHIYIKEILRES